MEKFKLIWATDCHLDFCKDIPSFIESILYYNPDQVLLTGDISNALQIVGHLKMLADGINVPINFVLGNHDYYSDHPLTAANMADTRKKISKGIKDIKNLVWLEKSGPVKLTDKTYLIGHSLWCDWRAGLGEKSSVWLNDYILIHNLQGNGNSYRDRERIKGQVRQIAAEFTKQLLIDFNKAVDKGAQNIIIGTHVPPWHRASFYDDKIQNNDWAAHFVCQIAGEKLEKEVAKHPNVKVHVYFGHTHGASPPPGYIEILPNLRATNGAAIYRHPEPQIPIIIE